MPAYYAEKTLKKTVEKIPRVYERVIVCDDGSIDNTYQVSCELGFDTVRHPENLGYGANQKTLYRECKKYGPDIIAMIHPDNQYDTSILPEAIRMIISGEADLIIGTRMQTAARFGMPWWKRASNKFLSFLQRKVFSSGLSEFHSGLRIFNPKILEEMPIDKFSNDFVFDSQFIAWCFGQGHKVGEIETRCFYNDEVSSINLKRSLKYGLSTLRVLHDYLSSDFYQKK